MAPIVANVSTVSSERRLQQASKRLVATLVSESGNADLYLAQGCTTSIGAAVVFVTVDAYVGYSPDKDNHEWSSTSLERTESIDNDQWSGTGDAYLTVYAAGGQDAVFDVVSSESETGAVTTSPNSGGSSSFPIWLILGTETLVELGSVVDINPRAHSSCGCVLRYHARHCWMLLVPPPPTK